MRPSRTTVAAAACAALVALLYLSPVLPAAARMGLDWPIWITHSEGLCNTSYGKWWVLPPHRPLVDGSSGEFPTYYQNLSDALVILIAELGGWPAITVQAVIYAPALAFAFLFANYLSIAAVTRDRWVALWASLLISLGGNSTFFDRYDAVAGQPLERVLHVPFQALPVATAQSLGWVLFLPCLALAHLAYRRFSRGRAIAAGLLLALLFYAHSLTFVNVAAAQLVYLILANATERPRGRRFVAWCVALGAVAAAFVYLVATRPIVPFVGLVGLGLVALLATFLLDPGKRFYIWTYLTAGVVAAPYLLVLARYARAILAVQDAWSQVQTTAVSSSGVLLFFLAYILASGAACFVYRDRSVLLWLAAILGASVFLALNHVWHWHNHSYRFAINMIFPLGILSALALRHGPRPLALGASVWLGLVCAIDVGEYAAGNRPWVAHRVAEPERAAFLRTVRETTAPHEGSGLRILNPPELSYARGVGQAAMLMNYSRIRAFVPDYRFVLWRERYYNRMGLFCFLFPSYPNADFPFGRRACEERLDPDRELVEIVDPRIKTSILPLYAIGFAGAPAKPFASFLKEARLRYGWPTIVETDSAALLRTDVAVLPGVASMAPGESSAATLAIRLQIDAPGPQLAILGGRKLAERAPRITLDGRALEGGRRSANWAVFDVELPAGPHVLELPAHATGPEPEADYLYFAAVVHRDHANRYLRLAHDAAEPVAAARQGRLLESPPEGRARLEPFFQKSYKALVDSPNGSAVWWHSLPLPDGNRVNGHNPDKDLQLKMWGAMQIPEAGGLAGKKVLDIGANDGFFTVAATMAGAAQVTAIDKDWSTWPMNIDYSCRTWHVDPRIVSGDFLSYELEVYDVIFLLGVLYHLENLPACMRRLRALLVEGGVVYVETQMSQIKSQLPIFEYASDIYPTVAIQDKKNLALVGISNQLFPNEPAVRNLAHSYDFACESLSGPHNAYTRDNPYRQLFKLTKRT